MQQAYVIVKTMDSNSENRANILTYIDTNPVATLGTINEDGTPHGSIVYVCTDDHHSIVYFLTKAQTRKYKNLTANNHVSLTIANPSENSTLQASGTAAEIQDAQIIDAAMNKLTRLHVNAVDWLPPIAKLRAGPYVLVAVTLQYARLAEFQGMSIGDEHIFRQM